MTDAAPDLQAMLRELGGGGEDPRMAMLMKFMQPPHAPPLDADPEPDERNAVIEDLSARLDAAESRLERMRNVAHRLHGLHQTASGRLSELAAALGACGLCWGDDEHCPGCRGRGRPGMMRPDKEVRARLFGSREPTRNPIDQGEV